jgi:hypothetical protein
MSEVLLGFLGFAVEKLATGIGIRGELEDSLFLYEIEDDDDAGFVGTKADEPR